MTIWVAFSAFFRAGNRSLVDQFAPSLAGGTAGTAGSKLEDVTELSNNSTSLKEAPRHLIMFAIPMFLETAPGTLQYGGQLLGRAVSGRR